MGCFSKGLSNVFKSDDLTEVAAEYCEFVLDVLRLTLRLVKKVLVEGLQLALEGECPTKVGSFVDKILALVKDCRSKCKSMSTGIKLDSPIKKICILLKGSKDKKGIAVPSDVSPSGDVVTTVAVPLKRRLLPKSPSSPTLPLAKKAQAKMHNKLESQEDIKKMYGLQDDVISIGSSLVISSSSSNSSSSNCSSNSEPAVDHASDTLGSLEELSQTASTARPTFAITNTGSSSSSVVLYKQYWDSCRKALVRAFPNGSLIEGRMEEGDLFLIANFDEEPCSVQTRVPNLMLEVMKNQQLQPRESPPRIQKE